MRSNEPRDFSLQLGELAKASTACPSLNARDHLHDEDNVPTVARGHNLRIYNGETYIGRFDSSMSSLRALYRTIVTIRVIFRRVVCGVAGATFSL